MSIVDRWLLPDGVEDVLPPQAARVEEARRRLLDLFSTWGYEYVIPPIVEYLESLLTGTGHDLDLTTLKMTDLLSGRMMGLRADITPQVARIDAHSLNRSGIVRLSYAGTVVHSKPGGPLESRTPLSVGAELFGDSSSRGDVEIVCLMIESLRSLGLEGIQVDLGHVAVYRQLVESLGLNAEQQEQMFAAIQMKSSREIGVLSDMFGLSADKAGLLHSLCDLTGELAVLEEAKHTFKEYPQIIECVDNLRRVGESIVERFKDIDLYLDLSELRGYTYHTGIVFAAYAKDIRHIVAKGGRYDDVGEVFGRDGRGATGFSINVRNISEAMNIEFEARPTVLVGSQNEAGLWQEVTRLRGKGYTVVESGEIADHDYLLARKNGGWILVPGED